MTLIVTDTGVGMTPEVMEHIFEPFFTTKDRGKGTGLGLSTAIGVVQQSGGFIDVRASRTLGARSQSTCPVSKGAPCAEETGPAGARAKGGRETILVAEDEDAVRTFVERVLTNAGYVVVTAATAPKLWARRPSCPTSTFCSPTSSCRV